MTILTDRSYLRYAIMGFLAIFIAACKPTAKFTVAPDEIIVGKEITFDATPSVAYKAEEGNVIDKYLWNFGDGTNSQGKTVTHTYSKSGKYTVRLEVKDQAGNSGYMNKTITVLPKPTEPTNVDATVNIETSNGAQLNAAQVSINGVEVATNKQGKATLTVPQNNNDTDYVITAKAEGFVTQSITVKAADLNNVRLTLLAEKFTTVLDDISKGISIATNILGASVSIPDNGFVTKTGDIATGKATVVITPWDINSSDSQAFLGNSQAVDAEGNAAELISAGMMTVDFYDANGDKLQLAEGKTAQIRMQAPNKSINGVVLNNNTKIPMWTFDESKGKWIEEGEGSVSIEGNVIYVVADVKHFSTWNWDFKFEASGTLSVQCVDSANAGIPCFVTATIVLEDGSTIHKANSIGATSTLIRRVPAKATITWTASTSNGLVGSMQAKISDGDVKIQLKEPNTIKFLTCQLPDGTKKRCTVSGKATLQDGSSQDIGTYNVSTTGVTIRKNIENLKSITWSATTDQEINASGDVVKFSGTAITTSEDNSANATVVLSNEIALGSSSQFKVECSSVTQDGATIDKCNMGIYENREIYTPDGQVLILPGQLVQTIGTYPTDRTVLVDVSQFDFLNKNYNLSIKASSVDGSNTLYTANQTYNVGKNSNLKKLPDTVLKLSK